MSLTDHLQRLQLADLGLDTILYNGGATTSNALYAGVPVITTLGTHYPSRTAASVLHAIGLDALVTHSLADYKKLAIDLATHPKKLLAIRSQLLANIKSSPLFDTQRFTRNLETAYQMMWDLYLKDRPPQLIRVIDNKPKTMKK
jgi:predicted O-linked N-acetylglucosamine transferase (SPINDLY family)